MAGGRQEAGFSFIGLCQFGIQLRQFAGALRYHLLQILIDLTQRFFIVFAFGDVHIGADKTTAHHGCTAYFHYDAVGQLPFELMGIPFA